MVDIKPICPHCKSEINQVAFKISAIQQTDSFFVTFFVCPTCKCALSVGWLPANAAKELLPQ
jgi:uncharacterized protein with PIN domain